jgi:hypothetical protein
MSEETQVVPALRFFLRHFGATELVFDSEEEEESAFYRILSAQLHGRIDEHEDA